MHRRFIARLVSLATRYTIVMKTLLLFLVIIAALGAGAYYYRESQFEPDIPQPAISPSENETTFSPQPEHELIQLETPIDGDRISSPLTIRGQARGQWFFEGTFPVVLTNWDGLIIAEGFATAEGEWMTENFVPFEAQLIFTKPEYGERGFLILKKDNPSGLPENDDALEITVFFE